MEQCGCAEVDREAQAIDGEKPALTVGRFDLLLWRYLPPPWTDLRVLDLSYMKSFMAHYCIPTPDVNNGCGDSDALRNDAVEGYDNWIEYKQWVH